MPRPPCERVQRSVGLGEQVEDARQHARRDADARCRARARTAVAAVALGRQTRCGRRSSVYLAALLSRLATTCASRVGSPSHAQRLARQVERRARGRARSISGRRSRSPRRDDSAPGRPARVRELDLAARDARDVEQVVDQPHQVLDLALDRSRGLAAIAGSGRRAGMPSRCSGVADRRQRIAQLVRQHRQELVLAPVGDRAVPRCVRAACAQVLARGDIERETDELVVRVGNARIGDHHRKLHAVLAQQLLLVRRAKAGRASCASASRSASWNSAGVCARGCPCLRRRRPRRSRACRGTPCWPGYPAGAIEAEDQADHVRLDQHAQA